VSSKPRILFLSHSASRNGATILLLHFLQWLKANANLQCEVLMNGRGELLDDFRAVCPTRVWRSPAFLLGSLPRPWQRLLKPQLETQSLKALLRARRYDLVYVNTVAPWQHVPFLATRTPSLLWHIHELEYAVRHITGDSGWRETFPLARRFVAVSESVKTCLTAQLGVPADKVDLVNGFIVPAGVSTEEHNLIRRRIRGELNWPANAFVVGGCGTLGWRKGSDVFLQIAQAMRARGVGDIRFFWVGGGGGEDALQFNHDLRAMNLEKCCHRIPHTARPADYYHAMDAFALTSREDPYPLVMLEAGAVGLPMVCFENSGGGPEFAQAGAGLIAPYMDVSAFTEHLTNLQANPDLRRQLGVEAARLVQSRHTVEMQAPKLLSSIERCLRPPDTLLS
jgi:glycosyltransferase involved in cell wall biosynthesis